MRASVRSAEMRLKLRSVALEGPDLKGTQRIQGAGRKLLESPWICCIPILRGSKSRSVICLLKV